MRAAIDGEVGIWTADAEGVFKGGLVGNVGATCTGVHLGVRRWPAPVLSLACASPRALSTARSDELAAEDRGFRPDGDDGFLPLRLCQAGGMATAVSLKGRVVVWEDGDYGKPADTLELCEAVSTMHFGDGYAFAGLRDGRVMVGAPAPLLMHISPGCVVIVFGHLTAPVSFAVLDRSFPQVYSCAEGRLRGSGKKAAVKEILSFAAHTAEVTCVQARCEHRLSLCTLCTHTAPQSHMRTSPTHPARP